MTSSFPSPLSPSLRPLLLRVGMNEREVSVYLALLVMKTGRVSAIARAAKQSRSHTYLVLQSLEEKRLVSHIERGKILHFTAERPERLLQYVQDREQTWKQTETLLEGALPYLKSLTGPMADQPRVTTLRGIDGMKQIYREIFPNQFCALFNAEAMYGAFGSGIPQLILKGSQGLKGRDLLVDNTGAKRFIRENEQNQEYEIRLLPKGITFGTDTMAYEDTLVIFAYDADHTIIRIENKNIADSFRAWFEMLWDTGKKTRS